MSADAPQKKTGEGYDVVLMHGPTADGEGARVIRARADRIEAGEVRPLREGRPLASGGEVVRLERRKESPALFDVHVDYTVPREGLGSSDTPSGPAQIATPAYRDSWERTFGEGGARAGRDLN
ncbi:MAG: chitosanase [Myxococcota bacterium]|nr:chitosanase [Myxococcota bacterium]